MTVPGPLAVSKPVAAGRTAASAATHSDQRSVYTRLQKIGKGAYGEVYKCFNNLTTQIVAIKILDVDTDEQEIADIQKEVALLSQLTDVPGVTKYHDSFVCGTQLWIVMDFAAGGSVRELMKAGRFEERYIAAVTRSVALALTHLHKWGIIHRDIKAANILLTQEGLVRLCDFGVAGQVTMYSLKRNSFVGSPYWMAPEVISEMYYNFKADIWSLGITVFEMAMGNPPFADQDPMRAIFLIPRTLPARLPHNGRFSGQLREFVAWCLRDDPEERPTAEDLLKSRLLKSTAKTNPQVLRDLIVNYELWQSSNPAVKTRSRKSEADQLNVNESTSEDEENRWQFETVRGINAKGEALEAAHENPSPPAVPRRTESRIQPPPASQGLSCSTPVQRSFSDSHPLLRLFAEDKTGLHGCPLLQTTSPGGPERHSPQSLNGTESPNLPATAKSPMRPNRGSSPPAPADGIPRPAFLASPVCDSPLELDSLQDAIVESLEIPAGPKHPTVHDRPLFDLEDIERRAPARNPKVAARCESPTPPAVWEQRGSDDARNAHDVPPIHVSPASDSQGTHFVQGNRGLLSQGPSVAQQADGEQKVQNVHVPEALDEMGALPANASHSSALPAPSSRSTSTLKRAAALSRKKSILNNGSPQPTGGGPTTGLSMAGPLSHENGVPSSPSSKSPKRTAYSGPGAGVPETERATHLPRPSRNDSLITPETTEAFRRTPAQQVDQLRARIFDARSVLGAPIGRARLDRQRNRQPVGQRSKDRQFRRSRSANSLRERPVGWTAADKKGNDYGRTTVFRDRSTQRNPEPASNIYENLNLRGRHRRRSQSLKNLKSLKIYSGPDSLATILLPPSPSLPTRSPLRRVPSLLFQGPRTAAPAFAPFSASQLSLFSVSPGPSLQVLLAKPKPSLGPLVLESFNGSDTEAPVAHIATLLHAVDMWLEILEGGFRLCAYG